WCASWSPPGWTRSASSPTATRTVPRRPPCPARCAPTRSGDGTSGSARWSTSCARSGPPSGSARWSTSWWTRSARGGPRTRRLRSTGPRRCSAPTECGRATWSGPRSWTAAASTWSRCRGERASEPGDVVTEASGPPREAPPAGAVAGAVPDPVQPPLERPRDAVPLVNLANALTVLRIVLVPVFVAFTVTSGMVRPGWRMAACVVFSVASVTDLVDGWIARTFDQVTAFGKVADPIADKALTGTALVLLSGYGRLSWWATAVILVRELGV